MKSEQLEQMNGEKIKKIYDALVGENITAAQFAIKACIVNDVKDELILEALKKISTDTAVKLVKISDLAIAALDILEVEKYEGENALVKELIKTKFYTQ